MQKLSIGYITARKRPMISWFLEGLIAQKKNYPDVQLQIIVVDYWKSFREQTSFVHGEGFFLEQFNFPECEGVTYNYVEPLPSLLQGRYQITKETWYACAQARNTVFVHADYDAVAMCDDLTVLGERWLEAVIDAAQNKYVALGAYQKGYDMIVENGKLISCNLKEDSYDSRRDMCGENEKVKGHGGIFFGCSSCMPLESLLAVNGFDGISDITRYEDAILGIRLERTGNKFFYDKRMFTTESNDHPQHDFVCKSEDLMLGEEKYFEVLKKFGIEKSIYPEDANKDCSHILIELAYQHSPKAAWNFYDLRELRNKRIRGEEITIEDMRCPSRTWFNDKLISEM